MPRRNRAAQNVLQPPPAPRSGHERCAGFGQVEARCTAKAGLQVEQPLKVGGSWSPTRPSAHRHATSFAPTAPGGYASVSPGPARGSPATAAPTDAAENGAAPLPALPRGAKTHARVTRVARTALPAVEKVAAGTAGWRRHAEVSSQMKRTRRPRRTLLLI